MQIAKLTILTLVMVALAAWPAAHATVVTYPAPPGLTDYGIAASRDYDVTVDGKSIFLYTTPLIRIADESKAEETTASFGGFDFSGSVEVKIHAHVPIQRVVVRPLSAGVKPAISGGELTFRLAQSCNLLVEINGEEDITRHGTVRRPSAPEKPLCLFANPLDLNTPTQGAPGVRYFGPGVHHVGHLEVKSNETLYLAGGAVLDGTLWAEGASNIRVIGRGMLDGSHTEYKKYLGIDFHNCKNVTIDGITVRQSPHWTVVPTRCSEVVINNIKILNYQTNGDGVDPCNCQRIRITGCFIYASDDCISPKGCTWWHKDTVDTNLEDLVVSECLLMSSRGCAGIKVGSETRAPHIRNLTFRNLDVYGSGPAFMVLASDRAVVSGITFEDARIERYDGYVAMVSVNANDEFAADKPQGLLGYIDGVTFRRITVPEIYGEGASLINGSDLKHPVKNLVFEDVRINGKPLLSIDQLPGRLYPLDRPMKFVENIQFRAAESGGAHPVRGDESR